VELRLVVVFECRICRKVSQVDLLDMVERHGANATLGEIRFKAGYSAARSRRWMSSCESRDGAVRKPGGRGRLLG